MRCDYRALLAVKPNARPSRIGQQLARWITSTASSMHLHPTGCGRRTSLMSRHGQASFMLPSSSAFMPVTSRNGRSAEPPTRALCLMLWSRPSTIGGPSTRAVSFTTVTAAANISRSNIPSDLQKQVSSYRSAALETAMTMLSPRQSTAYTKPK